MISLPFLFLSSPSLEIILAVFRDVALSSIINTRLPRHRQSCAASRDSRIPMKDFAALLALPASLLTIFAAHALELPWPYNLPRTVKYYPEHEAHVKREAEVQERLAWQAPVAVKKMGDDVGEKFFLDYWGFGDRSQWGGLDSGTGIMQTDAPLQDERYANASLELSLFPPIAPHLDHGTSIHWLSPRNIFKRNFECPTNTRSCSAIGASNLCCQLGERCVSTYEGVGCCPNGAACGDAVGECDTSAGYTSCPGSSNGGCCIPGAVCEGVGCVYHGTRTVTRTLPYTTATTRASYTVRSASGTTVTVAYPTTVVLVTTKTVTYVPSTQIIYSSSALTCKVGYFSCPGNYGPGCCPNGQACGPGDSCPDISTSVSVRPPVTVTSYSISPQSVSTTAVVGCPTGYYMCSARYLGGCCEVGRDCHTTHCPPQYSTTLINSPVTVVGTKGGGNGIAATQGHCANGWYLCGAGGGGGCCPSGYNCDVVSCLATNPGQKDTLKMAPSSANILGWAWSFLAFGVITGIGMIVA